MIFYVIHMYLDIVFTYMYVHMYVTRFTKTSLRSSYLSSDKARFTTTQLPFLSLPTYTYIHTNTYYNTLHTYILYSRKVGEFGKSSLICQTKIIQISTYNYNLLTESIHSPNIFCQMLKTTKFPKLSPCQTFLLYSIIKNLKKLSRD